MTRRRPWTDADRDMVRRHYADTPTAELAARLNRSIKTVYTVAYKLGLRKSDTYFAAGLGGRTGDGRGAATRFQPGHVTWNKGTRYIAGGRSAETRFRAGRIPHTWQPVGTYRVRKNRGSGYLEQKMTDTRCTRRDWIAVHRMVWEAAHGPIPPNHVVAFRPGRKSIVLEEITLDALELVSRQEMIRRNTIHRYPVELRQNIKLLARAKKLINKKESTR